MKGFFRGNLGKRNGGQSAVCRVNKGQTLLCATFPARMKATAILCGDFCKRNVPAARTCVTSGVFDAVRQHLGTEIRENKIFYSLIIVVRNEENFLIMMDKVWQTASTLFNRVWKRNLAKKFERNFFQQ